jgi:hypothetical protein
MSLVSMRLLKCVEPIVLFSQLCKVNLHIVSHFPSCILDKIDLVRTFLI